MYQTIKKRRKKYVFFNWSSVLNIPQLVAESGTESNVTVNADLYITNSGYSSITIGSLTVKVRQGAGYIAADDTILYEYEGPDSTSRTFDISNATIIHIHVQTYGGNQAAYMNNIVLS